MTFDTTGNKVLKSYSFDHSDNQQKLKQKYEEIPVSIAHEAYISVTR